MPPAYDITPLPLSKGAVATLVHLEPEQPRGVALLYVHGFSDYFFQDHLAEHLVARGVDLWALDLRNYGRSLRPGDVPAYVTDLSEHFEELDAALRVVVEHGGRDVVVMGHSTGGLITPLWLDARAGTPDVAHVRGLVLNSPWFELAGKPSARRQASVAAAVVGRVRPKAILAHLPSAYGRSLHTSHGGEWDFDLTMKPLAGFPVRAGWLRAIRKGHARLHRGLHVPVPALLLRSDASRLSADSPTPKDVGADVVLDVADMEAHQRDLGTDVEEVVLPGALHDVLLSPLAVRTRALDALDAFVDRVSAATTTA